MVPFSLGMLLELLFGELGPEPGALLHAESVTLKQKEESSTHTEWQQKSGLGGVPTCHVERAFLGGGDGAVSAPEERAAPALANLLLQPRAQLQVGLRGWKEEPKETRTFQIVYYITSNSQEIPSYNVNLTLESQMKPIKILFLEDKQTTGPFEAYEMENL